MEVKHIADIALSFKNFYWPDIIVGNQSVQCLEINTLIIRIPRAALPLSAKPTKRAIVLSSSSQPGMMWSMANTANETI